MSLRERAPGSHWHHNLLFLIIYGSKFFSLKERFSSGRQQTRERARGGWRDCVLPDPFSPLSQASRLSICEKAKIGILKSIWLIWTQPRFHWGMVYINVGWMTGVGLMAGCRFAGKQADYRPEALAEACCGSTTPHLLQSGRQPRYMCFSPLFLSPWSILRATLKSISLLRMTDLIGWRQD